MAIINHQGEDNLFGRTQNEIFVTILSKIETFF